MERSEQERHVFDAAIALAAQGAGLHRGRTHPAYGNMVGPFGGAIAATLLNAVLLDPARLGDPVALTVHFAAPIADGEFTVAARALRTNRTTQHWLVELTQEGQVAAFATAVSALRRDTWGATEPTFPAVPPADRVPSAPPIARAAWTSAYDMRFVEGGPNGPDSAERASQTRLWVRDQPPRPLDFASLAAICDVFYPRIFLRRRKWTPVGTVTLTTYFHADSEDLAAAGSAHLLGAARGLNFGRGFFDQSAEVWTADGILLATSHQIVYFKE